MCSGSGARGVLDRGRGCRPAPTPRHGTHPDNKSWRLPLADTRVAMGLPQAALFNVTLRIRKVSLAE